MNSLESMGGGGGVEKRRLKSEADENAEAEHILKDKPWARSNNEESGGDLSPSMFVEPLDSPARLSQSSSLVGSRRSLSSSIPKSTSSVTLVVEKKPSITLAAPATASSSKILSTQTSYNPKPVVRSTNLVSSKNLSRSTGRVVYESNV